MIEYKVDTYTEDGLRMKYLCFGEGNKTLVIIPGVSFRPLCADPAPVVAAFENYAEEYTIYLFDRKEDMKTPYTVEDMADDTVKAMKTLGLRKACLYGASQGGMICLYIALKHPEMVSKMLVASSASYIPGDSLYFYEKCTELIRDKDVRSLVRFATANIYSKEFYDAYHEAIIEAYRDLSEYELEQFRMELEDRSIYLLDKLPDIKAETMLVAAKGDKIFGILPTLQMAAAMNCECVIYDDYSHAVYDEAEDFRERMFRFFS